MLKGSITRKIKFKNKSYRLSLGSSEMNMDAMVSKDGVIIDGNRRASILNRINAEDSNLTNPLNSRLLDSV